MAYIGPLPAETFTSFATQEFSTSATTSYTLDHAVTNENEIALFINNVRQQPGSGKAYTATGTALTLSAATASTDTMYAVFLGRALQTVNPAGGSVGSSQIAAEMITGQTALAATPADTDELLISDAGTLKRIDYSYIKGGGGLVPLAETTGSNVSAISFDGYFTSDYAHYKIIYSVYGATNNTDTIFRVREGNSDATGSNYWYAGMAMYRANGDTSANNTGDNGATFAIISSADNTNNSQYPTTGEMILFNPLSTSHNTTFTTTNIGYNSASTPNAIRVWTFAGQYVSTTATSGFTFLYDGGNINGTIRLYGIKNSA